jgi:predicted Zn-dependent protease
MEANKGVIMPHPKIATWFLIVLIPLFLINAGASPSSDSSSSGGNNVSSSSTSMSALTSFQEMELKNGLRMIESLTYGKKYKLALSKLKVLDNKFSDNADINNYLGFVNRKMNELGKSAYHYKKALSIEPRHIGALEYQGELFIMTKKFTEANNNLRLLKMICGSQCKEYLELKKALNNAGK